ncbi:MAG: adenylate kinase [Dehalococcoidia bacterium]|nr:adenylate kinase [Dehalococcoidia bacterium]
MYVILLGPPGAGKGTQAANISKTFALAHVASGELFREAMSSGSELGLQAKSFVDRGELVPDELTIKLVMSRLEKPDCEFGCLLDGFPRTTGQAEALDSGFAAENKKVDKVLFIKVSDEELLRRLSGRWICKSCQTPYHMVSSPPKEAGRCDKCGGELYQRSDDTPETARNRLGVYFRETAPLISYYHNQGKLVELNGDKSIDEVGVDLIGALR